MAAAGAVGTVGTAGTVAAAVVVKSCQCCTRQHKYTVVTVVRWERAKETEGWHRFIIVLDRLYFFISLHVVTYWSRYELSAGNVHLVTIPGVNLHRGARELGW